MTEITEVSPVHLLLRYAPVIDGDGMVRRRGVKPLPTRDQTGRFLSNRFSVGEREVDAGWGPCADPIGINLIMVELKKSFSMHQIPVFHDRWWVRFCWWGILREGFYAPPASPSITVMAVTQEGRKTPPYVISHRESNADKWCSTGNGGISFRFLLSLLSSTILRLMRIVGALRRPW